MINMQDQQEQQFPPEIYNLAITSQLGVPTAEYKTRVRFKIWLSVFCLVFATLALLLVLLTFLIKLPIPAPYTPWHILVLGLLALSYGLRLSFIVFPVRAARVYVCPAGLLLIKGNKTHVIRWDLVASVWHKNDIYGYVYDTHLFTLRLTDKQTFKFDSNWHNLAALGETIMNETAHYLFPQAMAAYNSGNPVAFGDLKLSWQGISGRKKSLAWQQIKNIDIGATAVTIESIDGTGKAPWARFRVAGMPNFLVFERMLDSVWAGQQPQQRW